MKLSSVRQIQLLVALLIGIGLSAAAYKHLVLGFPLLASQTETVWQLEGRIIFEPQEDGPVEIRLNLPDHNSATRIISSDHISPGFSFDVIEENGVRMGRWRADKVDGSAVIYMRSQSYQPEGDEVVQGTPLQPMRADFEDSLQVLAQALLTETPIRSGIDGAIDVLQRLNSPSDERIGVLMNGYGSPERRTYRAGQLLALAGYKVEPVSGIFMNDQARSQGISYFLEVDIDGTRQLLDAREIEIVPWDGVALLQRSGEPLLEVFGGSNSKVSFSTTRIQRAAFTSAVESANRSGNMLIDFSIYSLPLSEQNTFKLLLLLPLGALVVVILRNLVGLRTSGTFMPILIALTFLQTTLLTGLMLFLVVVGVGLILRSYLSHLNLLLVPRIASVLVFVIIIYGAIGIISAKMGWEAGFKVTFFPMIILSWTIERMSILWDEEGGHEVMIEVGGSLFTACLAYLLMSNVQIRDTIFLYPELLLPLLAIIIAIGSYTGYRLSDLRRFEPMERHDK